MTASAVCIVTVAKGNLWRWPLYLDDRQELGPSITPRIMTSCIEQSDSMTSVMDPGAIHPDFTNHVREARSPGTSRTGRHEGWEEDDGEESDDTIDMEQRMTEMKREDAEYVRAKEAEERHRPHSPHGRVDERPDAVDCAIPPFHSPESIRRGTAQAMTRTVTINEPIRDSIEKGSCSASPHSLSPLSAFPSRQHRRPRTLSLSRTGTSTSFATFPTFVSDSGDQRRDPSQNRFWAALWDFAVGGKDGTQVGPRKGDPDYIPPKYRWTPIVSGLLQPFSILLEIPALTEHWYVRTENHIPVVYKPNPAILDVGLAISMACAVVANIALVSRFLERRVLPSTLITIVGLSIHDLINIAAIAIFGIIHRFSDGFTLSEAYCDAVLPREARHG